ncbi:hypothetical protein ppKF707_1482 [Metapseudomonas furukawaii]|uniref:Uncharacterized protein n=1 Tax=Metapseudomonas furukawaii TaxID=1149133 RepID=A0AAD1C1W5_METFU|nr:hypothetical protein ppKF707_1482 [Pseudomonas furukawaii]BAU74602.1 hypothetical protein KF707C_29140 [Pseudomonas furukawaii]
MFLHGAYLLVVVVVLAPAARGWPVRTRASSVSVAGVSP